MVSPNSRGTVGIFIQYIHYSLVLIFYFSGGGGGCNVFLPFYAISNISRRKQILGIKYFSFNVFFVFFYARSISNILRFFLGNIEKCPITYWLNGWWFPQIVDRDSGSLYPIYMYKKCVVLASEPVGGRSRATELPCYLLFFFVVLMSHSVMRSSWHFSTSGFNIRFPKTPKN